MLGKELASCVALDKPLNLSRLQPPQLQIEIVTDTVSLLYELGNMHEGLSAMRVHSECSMQVAVIIDPFCSLNS